MFLAQNRELLARKGVLYPRPPGGQTFAHHGIAWDLHREHNPKERRPVDFTLEQALAEFRSSEASTLFLSSEDFLLPTFYPGYLESLVRKLREHAQRIVVAALVRNRRDFFTSSYNQWVKSLRYTHRFDRYLHIVLRDARPSVLYTRALDQWAQFADEAVYLPLVPIVEGQSIERTLVRRLGIKQKVIDRMESPPLDRANASIGPMALLAYRRTTGAMKRKPWFNPFRLKVREHLLHEMNKACEAQGWNDERFSVMTRDRIDRIQDLYRVEDQQFAQRYFGADWLTVFPQELEVQEDNERRYTELDEAQRKAIDSFVRQSFVRARDLYRDAGPG